MQLRSPLPIASPGTGRLRAIESARIWRWGSALVLGALIAGALLPKTSLPPVSGGPPDCGRCHASETRGFVSAALVEDEPALCISCHLGIWRSTSHPIGMVPTEVLPREFPVDGAGRVGCRTCHHVHADQDGKQHGGLRSEALGSAFCLNCHELSFFDQMVDGGSSLLPFGHVSTGAMDELGEVDILSAGCLACHDGGVSPVSWVNSAAIHTAPGTPASSHPVGVDYATSASFGGYRDAFLLPSEMLLPNGKVSCVSCHAVYVADHGAPVVSMSESRLCFSCHDL